MHSPPAATRDREYEQLLHDGITAAKNDQRRLAQSLLRQATILDGTDARPYIWLSATTDDPQEKRAYLEQAVAVDPMNVAARRGLALLAGLLDPAHVLPEGAGFQPPSHPRQVDAQAVVFDCPQCGGRMAYSVLSGEPTCEYCGSSPGGGSPARQGQAAAPGSGHAAELSEQSLEFVIPTPRGQGWSIAQHRLACQRCGALSILPPSQKTTQCPYCGSNQMVTATESDELVDPQLIAPFQIDEEATRRRIKTWLKSGLFSPDDLLVASSRFQLRPAYYSCWTFDGLFELVWTCEVRQGNGRYADWETCNGVEARFFDDVLVSGVRALSNREIQSIAPFDIKGTRPFQPDLLAGWPTLIYDLSLADASLVARQVVFNMLRGQVPAVVEPGREKRNLRIGSGAWANMTFKHVLLPVWIGSYHYRAKDHRLLVNGQTGKVGGEKPRDAAKLFLAISTAGAALFLVVFLLLWLAGLL